MANWLQCVHFPRVYIMYLLLVSSEKAYLLTRDAALYSGGDVALSISFRAISNMTHL